MENSLISIWIQPAPKNPLPVRARISRHYALLLEKIFSNSATTHAILLEDDLRFSPDFLTYLHSTLPYITSAQQNHTVCASAWNDNSLIPRSPHHVTLTSFFPGLGWALHRSLWNALRPKWPAYGTEIVGIGWDFWLRVAFEGNGWTCITPALSRVKHVGASGANVNNAEASNVYMATHVATVEDGQVQWEKVLEETTVQRWMQKVQTRLDNGTLIHSLKEATGKNDKHYVLPYLTENYALLAKKLALWPTSRGHFRHTLFAKIGDDKDILLYDMRKASRYFSLPETYDANSVKLVQGKLNESCNEACVRQGAFCSAASLQVANDCETMLKMIPSCNGCSHETGPDLPAVVLSNAPLETAGWCLVTERGTGEDGELVCSGRFRWTKRFCGCIESEAGKDEL